MTAPIHSWTSRICNGCHRVIRIRPANSASLIRRSNCCPNHQAAFTSKLSLTSQFSLSNVLSNSNMTSQRVDRRHLSTAADKVTTSKPGENLRHPSKSSTSRRRSKLKPKPDPPLTRRTKKETPVWDGSNATSQAIERRDRLLAKERRKRTAKIVGKKKMLDGILEKNAIDHAHNRVEVKNGAESSQKQVRKSIQVLRFPHDLYHHSSSNPPRPGYFRMLGNAALLQSGQPKKRSLHRASNLEKETKGQKQRGGRQSEFKNQSAFRDGIHIQLRPLERYGQGHTTSPLHPINVSSTSQVVDDSSRSASSSSTSQGSNRKQSKVHELSTEEDQEPRFGDSQEGDIANFQRRHRNLFASNRVTAPYLPFPPSRSTHTKKHIVSLPRALRSSLNQDQVEEKLLEMNRKLYFIVFVSKKRISKLAVDRNRVRTRVVHALRQVVREKELEMASSGVESESWKLRFDQLHVIHPLPEIYSTPMEKIKDGLRKALEHLGSGEEK